ncbi:MAG: hypothetical protein IT365_09665 [Candidatus Hydrogenedentes bacterium]|nr:hypothetical protein [Candidatus Hydrogenedentota bacterium]
MGGTQETTPGAIQRRNLPKKTCAAVCVGLFLALLASGVLAYRQLNSFMNPPPFWVHDSPTIPVEAQTLAGGFELPESVTHVYYFRDRRLRGGSLMRAQLSPEDFSKYKAWLLSQERDVKAIQDMPKLPVMEVDLQHIQPWWPEQSAIGLQVFEYHWPSHYVILEEARHEVFLMNVGD